MDQLWQVVVELGAVVVTRPHKATIIITCHAPSADVTVMPKLIVEEPLTTDPPVVGLAWLRACFKAKQRVPLQPYSTSLVIVQAPAPNAGDVSAILFPINGDQAPPVTMDERLDETRDDEQGQGEANCQQTTNDKTHKNYKANSVAPTVPTDSTKRVIDFDPHAATSATTALNNTTTVAKSSGKRTVSEPLNPNLHRSTSAPSAALRNIPGSAPRPTSDRPAPRRRHGARWFTFEVDRLSPPPQAKPLSGLVMMVDTTPLRKASVEVKGEAPGAGFVDESAAETEAYVTFITRELRALGAKCSTRLHPGCNACIARQMTAEVAAVTQSQDVLLVSPLWLQAVKEQKRQVDVTRSPLYRPAAINKYPCCVSTSKVAQREIVFDAAYYMGWLPSGVYDRRKSDFLLTPADAESTKTRYAIQNSKPIRTLRWFLRAYTSGDVPPPEPEDSLPAARMQEMAYSGLGLGLMLREDDSQNMTMQVGRSGLKRVTFTPYQPGYSAHLPSHQLAGTQAEGSSQGPGREASPGHDGEAGQGQPGKAKAPGQDGDADNSEKEKEANGNGEPAGKRVKSQDVPATKKVKVAFTAVAGDAKARFTEAVHFLGGQVVSADQCTHLVVGRPSRTVSQASGQPTQGHERVRLGHEHGLAARVGASRVLPTRGDICSARSSLGGRVQLQPAANVGASASTRQTQGVSPDDVLHHAGCASQIRHPQRDCGEWRRNCHRLSNVTPSRNISS
eukprot:TRINITY_DN11800_c0_g1_i1.p1 TRINITY_DN11800_c0_g1~~TRINITY_DN11800_c0_g1_i1.p1  ORF type:complete len:765 (+),score=128.28 TRINITY_DN11800_c0_g1_i1:99-2297(+)